MANEHKGSENLIPGNMRSQEEARENGRKGGIKSGKVRREKSDFKKALRLIIDEEAPEKIKKAFAKNGYDIDTNREAVIAAILMGAMQGNPKMVEKVMELTGEDYKMKARLDEVKIQKKRLKMEQDKVTIEQAKAEAWMEALKNQQEAEMEDDGFMEALKGTAKDDWTDD